MKSQRTAVGRYSSCLTLCVLACLWTVAIWVPSVADAQGLGRLRHSIRNLTQPVIRSVRTVIRPVLNITGDGAGPVTALYMDTGRRFLFTVLGDGSARLWDLGRGMQLGGAFGTGIVSGATRGEGNFLEAVALRSDGSFLSLSPDGSLKKYGNKVEGIDSAVVPVLSAEGNVLVYRDEGEGAWRVKRGGSGESARLPAADPDARPIISADGSKIVYRTVQGMMVVEDALSGARVEIGGCEGSVPVTAGTYAPDGERVIFGDEDGNICVWRIPDREVPRRIFVQETVHPGAIRLLAIDPDGSHVAVYGEGQAVSIWTVAEEIRPVASVKLASEAVSSLLLDVGRRWVFVGESRGTVGIYSMDEQVRIARLISTDKGWAVVDRKGRFDGPQSGVDALAWAGETSAQTLPVDSFSESYFEPGLLGKLGSGLQPLLNEDVPDLSEVGYVAPPTVSIDPIESLQVDAEGRSTIRIRLAPNYPKREVLEVRLYHNGKLVPADKMLSGPGDEVFEYAIRLHPGTNTFKAVGVGPEWIEGQPAFATASGAGPEPRQPRMQVVAIGIGDYVLPNWELKSTRNDAKAIVSALRSRGSSLYSDMDVVTLLDSSATTSMIEGQLLNKSHSPPDVLVVFFAGHGYAVREEGERGGWEWYLLPYTHAWNANRASFTDQAEKIKIVRGHGLSSRRLMQVLTKTDAQHVFLILDSCRSGAVIEAVSSSTGRELDDAVGQKTLRRIGRVGGIHILAASRADEDAVELVSEPHGALTYLILEGIRGAADENRNRRVSVGEIIGYVTREMPLLSRRLVSETISQKPVGYSRGADFALAGW